MAERKLINRLHKCAFGEISLTMTQLRAIEILLRKSIPDLAAAEIKSEQTRRYVIEVPPVLDRDEWQRKYGQNPSLPPPSLQQFGRGQQSGAVVAAAVVAPRAERPATPKQLTRDNPRYRPSSKIVDGNPWPSLLSSLRPVLCAPKSGLPSSSFCVFVHCQCAICDLKFTMGFAANPRHHQTGRH
jgi:hypothetical protein